MVKQRPKKSNKGQSSFFGWVRAHKSKSFLILLLVLVAGFVFYVKYGDYQNRKLMTSLDRDLKILQQELGQELGTGVEYSTECFNRQEKYGTSPFGCVLVLNYPNDTKNSILSRLNEFSKPKKECKLIKYTETRKGFQIKCSFFVNGANTDLANELFNNR
jgi:hypothetical protein